MQFGVASQRYRLRLIGSFGLFTPTGGRIPISSRKSIALIALLAMAPHGERSRGWLRTMLWGNRDEAQAMASLRRELSNLATMLAAHGAEAILERDSQKVMLSLAIVEIDVFTLTETWAGSLGEHERVFLEGLDLPDCDEFEDWLRAQRSRIDALCTAVSRDHAGKDYASANLILGQPLPPRSDLIGRKPPPVPLKPSLAVLPFSSDVGGAGPMLGAAIADDVGHSLAQFPQLFVVASSAAAVLTDERMDHIAIARQLGVRFLIDGTIRQQGNDLRVNVRLLDGATASQLWTTRYDGCMSDLFALQDKIAMGAAPQIWTKIDTAERRGAMSAKLDSSDNYALFWRASSLFREWTADANREAIAICSVLAEREQGNAWVAALMGFCQALACQSGWCDDLATTKAAAARNCQFALSLEPDNVEILGYAAGTIVGIQDDLGVADRLIAHALRIMPSYQPTLFWGGWVDLALGQPTRGRERFELSLRINPASGVRAYTVAGIALTLLLEGRFVDAYALLADVIALVGHYPPALAGYVVASVMVGQKEVARAALTLLEQQGGTDAVMRVVQQPTHRQMLKAALDMARQ